MAKRPNFLIILIDDLRFDEFGAGGHPYMKTPHADRIAREGAIFERAFHTTPICSPNRASILTGQYASRHGIIDNVARDAASHRLPNYHLELKRLGYETAHIGKWHMGNSGEPRPGYDHWVSFDGHGRLNDPKEIRGPLLDRQRVVEEGAAAADYLLTMAIRALDYTPPVHLEFSDFLSALLTADAEIRPDDSKYGFRKHLLETFRAYGIEPASRGTVNSPGSWTSSHTDDLVYNRTHFEAMLRDADEVFSFIWENREPLLVCDGAYGHVLSVRPCLRIGPDGFSLRETVAEFLQVLEVTAAELSSLNIRAPRGMPRHQPIWLHGGNTLIFDEYGRLKFNIHNRIHDTARQSKRLQYLWDSGFFREDVRPPRRFAEMHLKRAMNAGADHNVREEW